MRSFTSRSLVAAGGRLALATATLTAAAAMPALAAPDPEAETMTVWEVDTRGRPPFQRSSAEVPVVDVAAIEAAIPETVTVWTVDHRGKPPYRRRHEEVPVVDAASLELSGEQKPATVFRGRPPFSRHRP
jgi:hypothetical protein